MRLSIHLIAIAIVLVALRSALSADDTSKTSGIKLEVTGFRSDNGKLGCSIFNSPEGFPRDGTKVFRHMWAPIHNGHGECFFAGVPAGDYAATIFHDENNNNKFDMNWMGMPLEGYGFSNNVKPMFKAPSFDECKFHYEGIGTKEIPIEMIYR